MFFNYDVNKNNTFAVFEPSSSVLRPRFVGTIGEDDTPAKAWDNAVKNNAAVRVADKLRDNRTFRAEKLNLIF